MSPVTSWRESPRRYAPVTSRPSLGAWHGSAFARLDPCGSPRQLAAGGQPVQLLCDGLRTNGPVLALEPARNAETPMPAGTRDRVDRLLGSRVTGARAVPGGYTPALRWIAQLADGRSVFVKHAVAEPVVPRLRREHFVYRHIRGAWCPKLLGFDDGEDPMLVIEDLSACAWPPPWDADRVEAVRAALRAVGTHPPPPGLATAASRGIAEDGWEEVARDPEPFLGLGLCSRGWLSDALPTLLDAADRRLLEGRALCHLDVRSDNLCSRANGEAVLVDWDCAAIGNPEFDLAFWLPSLHLEGGPPHKPWRNAPRASSPSWPGSLPPKPDSLTSHTRRECEAIQLAQLKVALPWVASVLGLRPPDPQAHAH